MLTKVMAAAQVVGTGVMSYGMLYAGAFPFIDSDLELAFKERFGKSIKTLQGKVVFITGASSGIGEHTAKALAQNGVKLVLAARRTAELERVKQNCLDLSKGILKTNDILVLEMDVLDYGSHQHKFDSAVNHFGGIDILFNNAGKYQQAFWEDIELDIDRQVFEMNVFSVINLSRIAYRYFNQKGNGHIVTTSSLAGIFGAPMGASYTASKHAIQGYMHALRNENAGTGLSVTLLCPGPVASNYMKGTVAGKVTEKVAIPETDTRDGSMSAERCGKLCAVAIANKTRESWIAQFPILPVVYLMVYWPNVFNFFLNIAGSEKLFKVKKQK